LKLHQIKREVWEIYIFGLFVSLFLSIAYSVYVSGRKLKRKKSRTSSVPTVDKKKEKVRLVKQSEEQDTEDELIKKLKTPLKAKDEETQEQKIEENEHKPSNIVEEARAQNTRRLYEEGYLKEEEKDYKKGNFEREVNYAEGYSQNYSQDDAQDYTPPSFQDSSSVVTKGGYNPSEMPRIFATRKDPTIFIYEYSKRLDFYKRTRSGMIYMYSTHKN